MGKTLDTYQKDKKYSFSCPAKALLRYFQRLVCRVSGEFCDIHAALRNVTRAPKCESSSRQNTKCVEIEGCREVRAC